jgi:hypothetical protein
MTNLTRRIAPSMRYWARRMWVLGWTVRLRVLARHGRRSLTVDSGPVVTLTTHGERIRGAHVTIESIGRGSVRPSRIVLWLDDEAVFTHLPMTIRRLTARGLEVRLAPNYGPHTKYFPYVAGHDGHAPPLITADDDVIYPEHWVERLLEQHREYPDAVIAYRARRIVFSPSGEMRPYEEWPFSEVRGPSQANFGTGHSGILYPAAMQSELRTRGSRFMEICARADDVWLHNTAIRAGVGVRLVEKHSVAFDTLGRTQRNALKHSNVAAGANDEQIRRTYSPADVRLVEVSAKSESDG